jgi:hypothetical protein
MLLGALYQYVYWEQFLARPRQPEADNHFVESLLNTLDRVLTPVAS